MKFWFNKYVHDSYFSGSTPDPGGLFAFYYAGCSVNLYQQYHNNSEIKQCIAPEDKVPGLWDKYVTAFNNLCATQDPIAAVPVVTDTDSEMNTCSNLDIALTAFEP